MLVVAALATAACDDSGPVVPDDPAPAIHQVVIWPRALYLAVPGDSSRITAVALDKIGREIAGAPFTWSVSDSGVITVDSTGLVTGLALGTASVAAATGGVRGDIDVEVDPVHSVARNCAPCHVRLEGDHAVLPFPLGSCWACHTVVEGIHGETTKAHASVSGGFELVGIHDDLWCLDCHAAAGGGLAEAPEDQDDCVACHRDEAPAGHAAAGFPSECAGCHEPVAWEQHLIDHAVLSGGFGLTGPHEALGCVMCHRLATFETRHDPEGPDDCYACHEQQYEWWHGASGYPKSCLVCHDGETWSGVTVSHTDVSGGFTLLGVHGTLGCGACHASGTFAPLNSPASERDCIACHQDDYDRQHAGSGYPFTCYSCHPPTAWEHAVFDHDAQYFPIYTGEHRNRWEVGGCATCHPTQRDFGVFTCFACHRHQESRLARDHEGVDGYVYESKACLACHPDGSA